MSNVRQTLESAGSFTPDQVDVYEQIAGMTLEEFKATLGRELSQKSRRQPQYWEDRQYNNPSQPVVGVTWFEANAYCAWLAALTGRNYRLPSEVEWEAAARGQIGLSEDRLRIYPWEGAWDVARANTIEGRAMRPTPVGAYAAAGGVGPFGAEDQAGNVWEWTSSLYGPYPYKAAEREVIESERNRVVRGGSWRSSGSYVRCAFRYRNDPLSFNYAFGFRVVARPFLRSEL